MLSRTYKALDAKISQAHGDRDHELTDRLLELRYERMVRDQEKAVAEALIKEANR